MNFDKKDEDSGALFHLDKTQVFQDARAFNASPIQPKKCRIILTKIKCLLDSGEVWSTREATDLFFGITKLFQHKDVALRQMVYIVIKDLSGIAEDTIMITSSIMKDCTTTSDVIYRPNAIRALCRIIDGTTVQAIERLIKTAIVDKSPPVSSAALISSYHLFPLAKEVVRRWASEAQDSIVSARAWTTSGTVGGFTVNSVVSSASFMTQYHGLGLLYLMRQQDRMAVTKIIQQFSGGFGQDVGRGGSTTTMKSPQAVVMLIRFASKVMKEDPNMRAPLHRLLEGWLRHKSDMVNFEAARAICAMDDVTEKEVAPALQLLQLFLTSPRFIGRFTAIRILQKFATRYPQLINPLNPDIEALISDTNRSIATYAITTLLKTGNEASVDRLMKEITGFMGSITDEFKVTIVEAIRSLSLKFSSKQGVMLRFLAGVLRDEGGFDFKKAVVEAMFDMIKYIPDCREEGIPPTTTSFCALNNGSALMHLCEFIEDCEYSNLAVRILYLLGVEGPKTTKPTKYIRYIYNRVVLENAVVRAAAVTALAKFGVAKGADASVKSSIKVLLTRCLDDPEDEVRDRAALNLKLLENEQAATKLIQNDSMFSLPMLERQLVMYISTEEFAKPFDLSVVPVITKEESDAQALRALTEMAPVEAPVAADKPKVASSEPGPVESGWQKYSKTLSEVPEFKGFGPLLKSSLKPVELTEKETEYAVTAIKHIFQDHIVLQFDVSNTLPDTVLENVSMISSPEDEDSGFIEDFIIPAPTISNTAPATIYVSYSRPEATRFQTATFTNSLKFTSKEVDPDTGEPEDQGYDDEYEVDNLPLGAGDYFLPTYIGNFQGVWDSLGAHNEVSETLTLDLKSIQEATTALIDTLSLQPLEGTDTATSPSTHTIKLSGRTIEGGKVVALAKMAFSQRSGVTLKLSARSQDADGAAQLVLDAVA